MSKWTKELPTEPGRYEMRDEAGGPTVYAFDFIDGELIGGPEHPKGFRLPVGTGMLKSARWRIIT